MKLKLCAFLLGLGLAGLTTLIGSAQTSGATGVPMEIKNGFLVTAKGSAGHLNDLTFLVDTGTSRTLIDSRLAEKLELTGTAAKLTAFNHDLEVTLVKLPHLRLGTIYADSPVVIATDLSGITQRFGFHVDAILGMDVLRLDSFSIDYKSKRIWFDGGDESASRVPLKGVLSLEKGSEPYLVVKASIDDLPVHLMIDTGHDGLMVFANRCPEKLRKGYSPTSRVLTVTGEAPLTQSSTGKLAVGSRAARKLRFYVVGTGRNEMGFEGIVGVRALDASVIHFDYKRMTVSWR